MKQEKVDTIKAILDYRLFENMIKALEREMKRDNSKNFRDILLRIPKGSMAAYMAFLKASNQRGIKTIDQFKALELGEKMLLAADYFDLQNEFLRDLKHENRQR